MSDQVPLCNIKYFMEFLQINLKKNILDYSLKPLTKPGDNYGSIMQSVDVKMEKEANNEVNKRFISYNIRNYCDYFSPQSEVLHLVCKTAVTNPYLIEIFQPTFTFVKETHFYSDIIPAIETFEILRNISKCNRIDAFIPCPGSRISLNLGKLILLGRKYNNYFHDIFFISKLGK